jgi:capsular exopolysaccharide synthesis family protein
MPKDQLYFTLLSMLDMKEVRNTDLIEIGVYSTDPKEASDIANTVAVCYQDKRRDDQQKLLQGGLGQLDEQVAEQRKKVQNAAATAASLRIEQGIIDLNPETLDTAQTTETQSVLADQQKTEEAKIKIAELKTQTEQLSTLKPGEIMVAIRQLGIEDQTLSKVLPVFQDSVAEEARLLNSGLGQKHPRVVALRATKAVYELQLKDAVSALLGSLSTKLKIAEATLGELQKKVSASEERYQKAKTQSKEYIEAKSAYIQAKNVLQSADTRLSTEKIQQQMTTYPAKIWEKAEPAIAPSKPNVPAYMALAVLIGLICGIGLAFFIEYLDTSVKTLDDVEKFLGIPVLAVVPKNVGTIHNQSADLPDAEAYRILRTNIEFNRKDPNAKTLTMISGGPGEGKSTTLLNLAYTCAKGGYNVLLVDADIRRPSQHRMLEIDNGVGLTNYLLGSMPFEEVVQATSIPNLSFMPSGILPADSVGMLNSQRMSDLIYNAKRKYDLVFLDSPPILGVSDGSVLASEVDMVVMVVEYRRFPRTMLQRVKQAIENVGGHLIGVVLNKVETKHDQGYQYYTNYYNYHTPREEEKPSKLAPIKTPGRQPQPIKKSEQY